MTSNFTFSRHIPNSLKAVVQERKEVTNHPKNQPIPHSKLFLKKLVVAQLSKKLAIQCEILRYVNEFTKAQH